MAPGKDQRLHHFLTSSPWDENCLLELLAYKVNPLVSGDDAMLVVDEPTLGALCLGRPRTRRLDEPTYFLAGLSGFFARWSWRAGMA